MKLLFIFLSLLLNISYVLANDLNATNVTDVLTDELNIIDPWVRAFPETAHATAAFMKIENNSSEDKILKSAQCEYFDAVELHLTVMEKGVGRMIPQESIIIPAHGEMLFKPGSYHIMLIKPNHFVNQGDIVPITLIFEDQTQLSIEAIVTKK